METMRVLLADDHALFRDGLAGLLRAWDMDVVAQAGDGVEAVERAREYKPALVLMDISMPRLGGLEATRQIKAERPGTKIVMLTVSEDERDLFEAVKAGAEGYLLKNMRGDDFGEMLSGLSAGVPPFSPSLAGKLLAEFGRQARGEPATRASEELTEREREVLQLVARGATDKEVAVRLGIAANTVHYHMKNVLVKLHARNRAEAAVRALREGLVEATAAT